MKKVLILTVLLVSVSALGFSQTAISGTYRYSANAYINFTGSSFTGSWNANTPMSGTFSVSGNTLTLNITSGPRAGNTWRWTIADLNTLRDQDGDSWRREAAGVTQNTNTSTQNTSMQNARQLQFNSQQTLNISGGAVHWFFIRSTESASVTVETTGNLDTMLAAFNESNSQIAEDDDSGEGSNARLTIQLEPNRQIYIRVRLYEGGSGNYTISARAVTAATIAYDRGITFSNNDNYASAIESFTEAIRLNPNYAEAYAARGEAYRLINDNDKALADFASAIRINPNYADTYLYRGFVYSDKGDFDLAIADYTSAIRLSPPSYFWLYLYRGRAYKDKGDYDRAIADYTSAIRLDATFGRYASRGEVYLLKGDYDRAIADFNEAIRLNEHIDTVYNTRGLAHEKKGNFTSALADFITALRRDISNYTNVRENLERLVSMSAMASARATWTVNNAASWIDAVNGIRNGGNNKVHTINVSGNISVPMSESITFGSATNVVIILEGGTLSPSSNGSLLRIGTGQTVIAKNITLRGRADNNNSLVRVNNGGAFRMEGSASVTGNRAYDGSGVYVEGGNLIMLDNSSVSDNSTSFLSYGGGGVYVNNGRIIMSDNATVSGNTADRGGGVLIVAGTFLMTSSASVSGNTASDNYGGGGVFVARSGTFSMTGNASVSRNTSRGGVGGVYVGEGVTFTMTDNALVSGNTASDNSGGGVYNAGAFNMLGGTISGNTVDKYDSRGGGVSNNGVFTMFGGVISSNKAANGGGVNNSNYPSPGTFSMLGGTISNNTAERGGGVNNNGNFIMQDGIISGNIAIDGGGVFGDFIMENGNISGNTANRYGGGVGGTYDTFTMRGGTISGNTAGVQGGGVYVSNLIKTGGIIYGNDAEQTDLRNSAVRGHAVYNERNKSWRNATASQSMNPDAYGFWLNEANDFPSVFIGTWKRTNFNNTITFTTTTLKSSSQYSNWELQGITGDNYFIKSGSDTMASITIKLVNGNLEISGDTGSGQDNWNGTWIKQ